MPVQRHGWHAFRRGLATNLHRLGVQDKIIQGDIAALDGRGDTERLHQNGECRRGCGDENVGSDLCG